MLWTYIYTARRQLRINTYIIAKDDDETKTVHDWKDLACLRRRCRGSRSHLRPYSFPQHDLPTVLANTRDEHCSDDSTDPCWTKIEQDKSYTDSSWMVREFVGHALLEKSASKMPYRTLRMQTASSLDGQLRDDDLSLAFDETRSRKSRTHTAVPTKNVCCIASKKKSYIAVHNVHNRLSHQKFVGRKMVKTQHGKETNGHSMHKAVRYTRTILKFNTNAQ